VSFSPDNVHETGVSPGGRSGSPVAAEARQVVPRLDATMVDAGSDVLGACCRADGGLGGSRDAAVSLPQS
jgi:hypothetical protein